MALVRAEVGNDVDDEDLCLRPEHHHELEVGKSGYL